MMKQKTKNELISELNDVVAVISVEENNSIFESLAANLAAIRKLKGVLGYILRSNTSAIIDLTEQDKISDYALLSFQTSKSSYEMAKQFNIANIESVLVEGKNFKTLCTSLGENKMSVFMEKSTNHARIIKKIHH